jgi:hypothetical protein
MPEHRSIPTPDQSYTRRGTRITALRGWCSGCPARTRDAAALSITRQRPRPSISEAPRLTPGPRRSLDSSWFVRLLRRATQQRTAVIRQAREPHGSHDRIGHLVHNERTPGPCVNEAGSYRGSASPITHSTQNRMRLGHPHGHPDDPSESVWTRPDRRGTQREQVVSVLLRPVRRGASDS